MLKLHEMIDEVLSVTEMLEESEVRQDVLQDTLESLVEGSDLSQKVETLLKIARELELQASAVEAEEKRLAQRKKMLTNNSENIRKYVFSNLERANISKLNTPLFSLTKAKARMSIEVMDTERVPAEFKQVEEKVSKTLLGKHVKELFEGKVPEETLTLDALGIKVVNDKKSWRVK